MFRKKILLLNIIFVVLGLTLVGFGIFVNFNNTKAVSNAGSDASVNTLSNGLRGEIYLQNSDLSEDVESQLVLDVTESEPSLQGFQLEIKQPENFMLYCNGADYSSSQAPTVVNSYLCTNTENILTITLDLQPTPPFKIQIRSLNREQADKVNLDYSINNNQGNIVQDQLMVINNKPTTEASSIDIKLIFYVVSAVYVLALITYLIYLKRTAKH